MELLISAWNKDSSKAIFCFKTSALSQLEEVSSKKLHFI